MLEGLGRRAHGEEKPAVLHVASNASRHRLLEGGGMREAQRARRLGLQSDHVAEPRRRARGEIELRELSGEVLMVQMEPLVAGELPPEHLRIPDRLVLDAGVLQCHCHGVVPRSGTRRGVHGHPRRLLQRNRLHVVGADDSPELDLRGGRQVLDTDAVQRRLAACRGIVGKQEAPTSIVEHPLGPATAFERAKRDPIGLEVVGLLFVHRQEHAARPPGRACRNVAVSGRCPHGECAESGQEVATPHVLGIIPRTRSSSRRACGTTALSGYVRIRCSSWTTASSFRSASV